MKNALKNIALDVGIPILIILGILITSLLLNQN